MSKFIVEGGHKLEGEVRIQGSKNSAFPAMAAAILCRGKCRISNVPDILDVRNFLEILEFLGAKTKFAGGEVMIDTANIVNRELPPTFMNRLRGSVVIAGALLGRFGQVKFAFPGGDAIGRRPIEEHLEGFRKLGAKVKAGEDWVEIRADTGLTGNRIVLGFTTVTGTENLILASVQAAGMTEIRLAACEPHVQNLCKVLSKMGARIEGIGRANLRITGVEKLLPCDFALNPDEIVTLTYCVAAAATKGRVKVRGVDLEYLDAPLAVLERFGVRFTVVGENAIEILEPAGSPYKATKIVTGVYPQLLTDYQPLFGVLATQAQGESKIHDWIYEGRQGYLRVLQSMGARVEFLDVHRARVHGPAELRGIEIKTPDIRAGASILIASLLAKGQSVLYNAEIIDRGYERIDERLNNLGAKIRRVE